MARIVLTPGELLQAAVAGVLRQVRAIELGRVDQHGYSGDGWGIHIQGCITELVVAKHLGIYWHSLSLDRDLTQLVGDVGPHQVRSTDREDGCLIVHPPDNPDARFFLVIVRSPIEYDVVGSLMGRDAKCLDYWRTDVRQPAYFVPQHRLEAA